MAKQMVHFVPTIATRLTVCGLRNKRRSTNKRKVTCEDCKLTDTYRTFKEWQKLARRLAI